MSVPFDYVQIVSDDDWELVGIVAPGSAGDNFKDKSDTPPRLNKRTMSNTPIVIRQHMASSQITPADKLPNTLSIDKPSNTLSIDKSPNTLSIDDGYKEEKPSDSFINLSGLTRNRANLLIGFGK